MLGLVFFCLGSVICMGGSRLTAGRYPRYVVVTLGITFVMVGLWLAFVGYGF
jgi:hypothetical protein